jgi:hypothetical protein
VEDWVAVQPFRKSAGNKTSVLVLTKGYKTVYPVDYPVYKPIDGFDREDADLPEVLRKVRKQKAHAILSDPDRLNSFWRIADENESTADVRDTVSASRETYRARKGIDTNLESAFRVALLAQRGTQRVLIRNVTKNAKKPVAQVEAAIEPDLLFPFVNGQSIKRWGYDIAGFYIVPHTVETGMVPIPEAEMKRQYPLTYAFLNKFREELSERPLHKRWGSSHPFYSLYNIGPYTFAPYRVAWKRSTKNFAAAVLGTSHVPMLKERLVLANADAMVVTIDSLEKAYFLCGLLNSEFARHRIDQSITTKAHRDIISVVPLPRLDRDNHQHSTVIDLSRQLHSAVEDNDQRKIGVLEMKLDSVARAILERTTQ